MIRCIIVDDEPLAQDLLQDYLDDFPDLEVVGKFNDGFDAFKGIGALKPDLIFLDIEMPKITGFELMELLEEPPKEGFLNRVVVKTGNKIDVLNVSKISSITADGDYVRIISDGKHFLKLGTMAYYEEMLDPQAFTRIHRSHMVNISAISKIEPYQKENYLVFLKDNTQLPVSKKGMAKLKKALRI